MDFILPLAIMSTAFLSLSRKVLKKYSASLIPSNYLSPNFDYLNDPIPPRLGIIGSLLSIFGNSIFGKFIGAIGIGVAMGPGIGILGLIGIGLGNIGIGSGNMGIGSGKRIGIMSGLKKSSERLMPGPKPKSSKGGGNKGGFNS
tara:strand:- start:32 stop:463 length:432 start_codon:yes stop_codon:yes gene_type:complete